MLCIYNDSPIALNVEHGDVLAVARALPPNFVDYRAKPGSGAADPVEPDVVDVAEDLLFPQEESFFQLSEEDRKELPDASLLIAAAEASAT